MRYGDLGDDISRMFLSRLEFHRDLIGSRDVRICGPLTSPVERQEGLGENVLDVWMKFLGQNMDDSERGAKSPHISYVNSLALGELVRRFGSEAKLQSYKWGRCQLLAVKGKQVKKVQISGIKIHKVSSTGVTWFPIRLLGMAALVECVAAGAKTLHLTGFNLHAGRMTHLPSYPLFAVARSASGGLGHLEVCLTHGTSDVFSQHALIRSLMGSNRVTVDSDLDNLIQGGSAALGARLERLHGVPSWL